MKARLLLSLWAVCAAGFVPGQALAGKAEFARPPYAGAYEPQGVDERGLWMEMDEEERAFRDVPVIMRDAKLTDYVRGVLCKAVGGDRCGSVRMYIVKDGSFNASMAPNGLMIVHTGLLARLHSEAELAAVLGHEFAHFERRHSLDRFRKGRGTLDAIAWISLAGAVARTNTANLTNGIAFSYYSFNRGQESEADGLSVEFLKASPYRLRASQVWRRSIDEDDALRKERGLRKIKRKVPGLLDTHPTDLQRIAFHARQEAQAGEAGEDGMESYRAATATVLGDLFEPLIKGNDFGAADYVIRTRGEALGWDAELYFLRGELYRLRGYPRDLATARELFQSATMQPHAPAESWRGLGLCSMRLGDRDAGRAALGEYLKRMPDAKDMAAIKLLLEN